MQRVKMGLNNVSKLLTALDSPYIDNVCMNGNNANRRESPVVIHVAGTMVKVLCVGSWHKR